MTSFPKISLKLHKFGERVYRLSIFNIFPVYEKEDLLNRIMEIGKFLHIPDFIYNNSSHFLYISSKLEKDLIHQQNIRNVTAAAPKVVPKAGQRR